MKPGASTRWQDTRRTPSGRRFSRTTGCCIQPGRTSRLSTRQQARCPHPYSIRRLLPACSAFPRKWDTRVSSRNFSRSRSINRTPVLTGASGPCEPNTSTTLPRTSSTCSLPMKSLPRSSKKRGVSAGPWRTRNGCWILRCTTSVTVKPSIVSKVRAIFEVANEPRRNDLRRGVKLKAGSRVLVPAHVA